MREWVAGHCSTGLPGERVFVTGGLRPNQSGSHLAEILNLQAGEWEEAGRMNQPRYLHTCTPVWVDKNGHGGDIFNDGMKSKTSELSVVVAGGKYMLTI